ncbi:ABC-three component system protein [Bradyrhizobium ottawaense]|uniref:ABC-three component system protein n=1 Tax=Bradyrhizobium ottawaense TaxID=931866 RepID=UPI001BA600A2|nr:ABC-three component system protein [Bradyrhizobium ottawaense]MBR1325703.1 hypothetical protein [Bradyrhizobium ottawaense]
MADPQLSYSDRATTVALDATILSEGKLQVCLMQISPVMARIAQDESRPDAVAAVRHLLIGGGEHAVPALSEMAPGAAPVLIVAPEFAFGSGDWSAVDEAIRQSNRPIVLIAGFGATPGQKILEWGAQNGAAGPTSRHFAWDQQAQPIGSARPVNGGWCWYHHPTDGTHCFTYLKSIAEQNVEAVDLAELQYGRTATHVRFNDLDLFPLICADMLQPIAEHPDSSQARIREVLDAINNPDRPALVIGSLLQHGYNVNWESAIDSFLNQVMADRRALVALCNVPYDKPLPREEVDRWRSLTGVYGKWGELTKGQRNLPVGRRLNVRGVVAAVVRRTQPTIASGAVDWGPYGPVDGKFVWHADMTCSCGPQGLAAPIKLPTSQHACELVRFARRHPPEPGWSPRVGEGLRNLATQVASGATPRARRIINSLLYGVTPIEADPDILHEMETAAVAAIHALAIVSTIKGVVWQSIEAQDGQLKMGNVDRNVLIWKDPKMTSGQMRRELGAWKIDTAKHPELIVIGGSRFGDIDAGPVEERPRDDVSLSPSGDAQLGASGSLTADENDITRPKVRRVIAAIGISRVAKIYAEHESTNDDDTRISQLLADIEGYFSKGGIA